jgi:hypothetical protein
MLGVSLHAFFVPHTLAFIDVAVQVITVAVVALVILVLGLVASAVRLAIFAIDDAEDMLAEAFVGLDPMNARNMLLYVRSRSRNPAVAFALAVFTGPFGANLYLGEYQTAVLALVTLNGLGAWWIESMFSIPQIVLIERRRAILAAQGTIALRKVA